MTETEKRDMVSVVASIDSFACKTLRDFAILPHRLGYNFKKVTADDDINKPFYVNVTIYRRWYQKIFKRKRKLHAKMLEAYKEHKIAGVYVELEVL